MARDAQQTRRRLLDAATAEFAERGIAGARVDRIAANAGCNKALIYAHFGNKDQLFDTVFDELVVSFVQDIPIDTDDLPGYAGRMFDRYQRQPELLRLAAWFRLERAGSQRTPPAMAAANNAKLAAIELAQREGRLPTRFSPAELLELVLTISTMGQHEEPSAAPRDAEAVQRRRRTITEAVATLVGQ